MFPDQDLDASEHAAFESMVLIRQIDLDGHGTGGAVQGLDVRVTRPSNTSFRISFGADVGALPDLHERHILPRLRLTCGRFRRRARAQMPRETVDVLAVVPLTYAPGSRLRSAI